MHAATVFDVGVHRSYLDPALRLRVPVSPLRVIRRQDPAAFGQVIQRQGGWVRQH